MERPPRLQRKTHSASACEDVAGDAEHDLLIEFFCGATILSEAETFAAEEEIETQLRHGRPALIFFSDARADFHGNDALARAAIEEFSGGT